MTAGHGAGNNPAMGREVGSGESGRYRSYSEEGYPDGLYHGCYGRRYRYRGCPGDCQLSKDMGILTVGIVSVPARFEGPKRLDQARDGLRRLKRSCGLL